VSGDRFSPPGRVLIAGCGYVGTSLGRRLAEDGMEVWGLRRDVTGLPATIRPLEADLLRPSTLGGLPDGLDAAVYLVSADASAEEAYRDAYVTGLEHLLEALGGGEAPRLLYVSSTGVYGESDGAWVDEETPPRPRGFRGRILREGEERVGRWGGRSVVVRFGGIYGPGRTRLIDRVRTGEARCPPRSPVYTNRIHRADGAGVLRHLLAHPSPRSLYLGVDREPAERCEVLRWIARRLGVADPSRDENGGRRARSNKRCSSDRLVEDGYRFRYPTFREGYGALLAGGEA